MSSPSCASVESVSDSGHSSPDSSNVDSPLVSFDRPLDESDALSFFLKSNSSDPPKHTYGDVSSDDTISTTAPSSSHDSPTADWPGLDSASTKGSGDSLWQQHDLSLFPLDGFDPSAGIDLSLGFDSMLFSGDPLFSMNSANTSITNSAPAAPSFQFNFGMEASVNANDATAHASDRESDTIPSSSGKSFKSATEPVHLPTVPNPGPSPLNPSFNHTAIPSSNDQLMNELASQARQLVGLTVALPFGQNAAAHLVDKKCQEQEIHLEQHPGIPCPSGTLISNLPAPLERGLSSALGSGSSSRMSTPAPATTRTKTSHTTIERRYRTNLNARIQSLRAAVPALRVLEVKQGNRVGNLSLKAGTRRVGVDPDAQPGQDDVIDERGYIDGVKVARKGSKANVLGKAVEYIHVLKRREMRLKREQEGLKALIRSLVGGPELVQQWERMWRERFGGPEKDEIGAEEAEVDDENDDGEEDDDAIDDRESEEAGSASGRKRKRAKADPLSTAKGKGTKAVDSEILDYSQTNQSAPNFASQTFFNSSAMPSSVSQQPEKRKRGRPRKVPAVRVPAATNMAHNSLGIAFATQLLQQGPAPSLPNEVKMESEATTSLQVNEQLAPQSGHSSGQQYLLAAFAFFSFFNSPFSYSSSPLWSGAQHTTHPHGHSGSVLGDPRSKPTWHEAVPQGPMLDWRDVAHITHLIVSILLLLSVVAPWFPLLARYTPRGMGPLLHIPSLVKSNSARSSDASDEDDGPDFDEGKTHATMQTDLLSVLSKSRILSPEAEAEALREALGLKAGFLSTILSLAYQAGLSSKNRSDYGLERRMLEQKAFLRFAELVAFDANASVAIRIQTYIYAFKFLSPFSASVKDITTLALIIRPLWRSKAVSLWSLARARSQGKIVTGPHLCKAYEVFVLERMTIDEAALQLASLKDERRHASADIEASVSHRVGNSEGVNEDSETDNLSPLAVLARHAIHDFVRAHAENVFIQSISGDACLADEIIDDQSTFESEIHRVAEAGRSLDARTKALVNLFERVCSPSSTPKYTKMDFMEPESGIPNVSNSVDTTGADIFALLRAIALYRRIFPTSQPNGAACSRSGTTCSASVNDSTSSPSTSIPSPPPSPSHRDAALHLALRRCLDSPAFDRKDTLEDARDRVVDLLTAESSAWPKRLKLL